MHNMKVYELIMLKIKAKMCCYVAYSNDNHVDFVCTITLNDDKDAACKQN